MPSKSAKTRKHNRKRARIELSARKTEVNRKRRLSNRVKRSAILDIDSNAKVKMIDQKTYIDGDRVEVVNGKIVPSALPEGAVKTECDYEDAVVEYQEVSDKETMDKYAIGEITAVKPEEPTCELPLNRPMLKDERSAFSKLKDKLRGV